MNVIQYKDTKALPRYAAGLSYMGGKPITFVGYSPSY